MTANDTLACLLRRTARELEREAASLVDVDLSDRGQQWPDVPACDREYFEALSQAAQELWVLLRQTEARDRK